MCCQCEYSDNIRYRLDMIYIVKTKLFLCTFTVVILNGNLVIILKFNNIQYLLNNDTYDIMIEYLVEHISNLIVSG